MTRTRIIALGVFSLLLILIFLFVRSGTVEGQPIRRGASIEPIALLRVQNDSAFFSISWTPPTVGAQHVTHYILDVSRTEPSPIVQRTVNPATSPDTVGLPMDSIVRPGLACVTAVSSGPRPQSCTAFLVPARIIVSPPGNPVVVPIPPDTSDTEPPEPSPVDPLGADSVIALDRHHVGSPSLWWFANETYGCATWGDTTALVRILRFDDRYEITSTAVPGPAACGQPYFTISTT